MVETMVMGLKAQCGLFVVIKIRLACYNYYNILNIFKENIFKANIFKENIFKANKFNLIFYNNAKQ